jgi:hypothetical protein
MTTLPPSTQSCEGGADAPPNIRFEGDPGRLNERAVYPICRCENNYVCLFYSALLITYLSTGPVSLIFHLALDQNAVALARFGGSFIAFFH